MDTKIRNIIIISSVVVLAIVGITLGIVLHKNSNSPIKPPVSNRKKFYGNWYYWWGIYCGATIPNSNPPKIIDCPVTLYDYLSQINVEPNTAFYLGTGSYEDGKKETRCNFASWDCDSIKDQPSVYFNSKNIQLKNQIINFGGYGTCDIKYGMTLPNNYCNNDPTSIAPTIVWTDNLFGFLPEAGEIINKGYTGASIDIEAVPPGDSKDAMNGSGLISLLHRWTQSDLDIIITLPGNGVKDEYGGMKWFDNVSTDPNFNKVYVCLMYYALINDTETDKGGTLKAPIKLIQSLQTTWSGPNSKYKLDPEQIILGLSFGHTQSPKNFFTGHYGTTIFELASGGISRWVEHGGEIGGGCYGTDCKK
jgi:hypothetical protein